MFVDIYETLSRTYRVDSDTLEEFKNSSYEKTKTGLMNYMIENENIDDYILDEEIEEIQVDNNDFNNFLSTI